MRGITPRREQGMADPVLASVVHEMGLKEARHYTAATPSCSFSGTAVTCSSVV
jgi:hypothetical protein